jgi:aromatic-L-amino-acid decarboxylase
MRWVLQGAAGADSLVVNPHKWLFVPLDCSVLYLRRPQETRAAFAVTPDYLQAPEEATALMDYGLALGRRWRSLKLWLVLQAMGTRGVQAVIEEHLRLARLLAGWVEEAPDFEVVAPTTFAVVNFAWRPRGLAAADADRATTALAEAVNGSGEAFLTTARIGEVTALHASIGNLATTEEDVARLWAAVQRSAAAIPRGEGGPPPPAPPS